MQQLNFNDAAKKLKRHGIQQHQIYLIDLVLLCEMAWADGKIQTTERDILFSYLNHHVDGINRLAGCRVIDYEEARDFVTNFLDSRPAPQLLDDIRAVVKTVRLDNKAPEVADSTRLDILNACLDIAASSVTRYPFGLKERFTDEEKEYYHKITRVLTGDEPKD